LIVNGVARPITPEIEIDGGSWIAARVTGPWRRSVLNDDATFAHTSPVYVRVGGELARSPADARFWAGWIDKLITRTIARGGLRDETRRIEVVSLFRQAQKIFEERAR